MKMLIFTYELVGRTAFNPFSARDFGLDPVTFAVAIVLHPFLASIRYTAAGVRCAVAVMCG